jgi:ubiquitin-like 1-activating enzyme E1 B
LTCNVDISKATLQDVVDFLKSNLEYDGDFSIVTTELIYDPDFDDNLETQLSALNLKNGSFITVHDEGDEEDGPLKVDVVIQIIEATAGAEQLIDPHPALPEGYSVPHKPVKPKPTATTSTNGLSEKPAEVVIVAGIKRTHATDNDDGVETKSPRGEKRRKVEEEGVAELSLKENGIKKAKTVDEEGDVVVIEDSGVIEID